MRVVISQSMYFPWVGLLEQVRLADIFVHYDDVQFTRGFYSRVQVKTRQGSRWMSVPLRDQHRGQHIDEVLVDDRVDWRSQHREILRQNYMNAPYRDEMLALVDRVFNKPATILAEVSRMSILALAEYFGLSETRRFVCSNTLGVRGSGSQRLHNIILTLRGDVYITGHGARNYLDHELFESSGIDVRYMQYRCISYPQQYGAFTPYVTGLDLVANCGQDGINVIQSGTTNWKEPLNESK